MDKIVILKYKENEIFGNGLENVLKMEIDKGFLVKRIESDIELIKIYFTTIESRELPEEFKKVIDECIQDHGC